jgi:hypothetical protein
VYHTLILGKIQIGMHTSDVHVLFHVLFPSHALMLLNALELQLHYFALSPTQTLTLPSVLQISLLALPDVPVGIYQSVPGND